MRVLREQGLWWLPGHEDSRVAGTLVTSSDDFARLELIGAFHGPQTAATLLTTDIILGVAGGRLVTLYKCVKSGSTLQMPGLYSERYLAHFVLLGAHFSSQPSVLFSQVTLDFDALFEWAGLSGLRVEYNLDSNQHLESIKAEFRFPESPKFDIGSAKISIEPSGNAVGLGFAPRVELAQSVAFVIAPNTAIHLDEYLTRYLHDLSNFLSLAVGAPVRILRFAGVIPASPDASPDQKSQEVEILFLSRDRFVKGDSKSWDMLFTLPAVRNEAEKALRRWFERADSLRPIYDLYFGTMFQQGAYVHQRFLSLAQALESYHRRVNGGQHLSESAFEPVRERLVAAINSSAGEIGRDVRQAFCNKLTFFNEISLRRRLKELLSSHRPYVKLLIRNEPRFVKRVVATRNYYTHYDEGSATQAVTEDELHCLSDQLQFLLELCLLAELGFDQDTIGAITRQHQRYLRWAQTLASFDPAT
jgi:hypothetical protein